MSYINGPLIVTNGLVMCLDAGNANSYPGTGTTWKDVSNNGNNATMYGNPSTLFDPDANGCFNFASVSGSPSYNASLGFSFTNNMVPVSGNFTFECWVKNPTNTAGQTGMFSNAGGGDGYRFGVGYDGVYCLVGPNYTEFDLSFTNNLNSSLWYHVVTTWDRTSGYAINLYRNGTYQNNNGIPSTQTASQNGAPGIVRSLCCGVYTGKLAIMKVYNRLLTQTEIYQNFNALRGRFGI
jgi:Concanavalin A-like lectin/glucanases superfamily